MQLKYGIFELEGVNRLSFSREELLYMLNQLDKNNNQHHALIVVLENLITALEKDK